MKLAEAFVEIKLQTKGFLSGLRRTEDRVGKSTRRIGRSFDRMGSRLTRTLGGLAASIAGAFTFAAIIAGIRNLTKELDLLAKRARTLGIGPNQLAGFGFGVSQTTGLSSLQGQVALERFTKRVGEASTGQGEGASVIKALGLEGISNANPVQQLEQFASALEGVTDRGLKLAYVQKLLGDEARLMLPYLELERSERQALTDELNKLRGNIAIVSASAERQSDALERSGEVAKRIGGYMLLSAEPAVVGLSNAFIKATAAIEKATFGIVEMAGRMMNIPGLVGLSLAGRAILGARGAGGDEAAGGAAGSGGGAMGRIGLNTQLGTFNISSNDVLNTLRNIAKSNTALVALAKARRGDPLT